MTDPQLDHLVYAVPDLAVATAAFADRYGVQPVPGGRHEGKGTRNYLVGLGGSAYLEIIGPDPESDSPPTWFEIAALTEPKLVDWAIRPADLDATVANARAAGYDPGEVESMSRLTTDGTVLAWRLTPPRGALVPFLIDWGTTSHPTTSGLPEVELVSFHAEHPDVAAISRDLAAVGARLDVRTGPNPGLYARFR
ncbi:VOC family protein [Actinophytocola sp.]|uniref:VOC family protein n=1 Tax=Actinophytocola sp. TaxID=1872138 RepID=UPI002ED4A258